MRELPLSLNRATSTTNGMSFSELSPGYVAYSKKCPSLAFGEASNALAVVELPTDAQKPTHTRSLRHSFFQAIGATPEALIAAHSPQCPPAFLSFCSSFVSLCLSPAFHKEISRLDRLERTIANSVDPLHPPVLSLLMRISLSQSR